MKAARQGFARAQMNVGFSYGHGEGVEKDDEAAFEWTMKAAKQGFAVAQNNLGAKYSKGDRMPIGLASNGRWCLRE